MTSQEIELHGTPDFRGVTDHSDKLLEQGLTVEPRMRIMSPPSSPHNTEDAMDIDINTPPPMAIKPKENVKKASKRHITKMSKTVKHAKIATKEPEDGTNFIKKVKEQVRGLKVASCAQLHGGDVDLNAKIEGDVVCSVDKKNVPNNEGSVDKEEGELLNDADDSLFLDIEEDEFTSDCVKPKKRVTLLPANGHPYEGFTQKNNRDRKYITIPEQMKECVTFSPGKNIANNSDLDV
ncbi:unnamed protein product, partial [Meganyctiphanes norvegica]